VALLAAAGLIWAGFRWRLRGRRIARAGTWDCGYAAASTRIQYTASSFAQFLVAIFAWFLKPRLHQPTVQGAFPGRTHFSSHVDDLALDRWILPAARSAEQWLSKFRRLQQGLAQSYLLYILLAVLAMLVWVMPLGEIIGKWFCR
jgi:hypothetical protein